MSALVAVMATINCHFSLWALEQMWPRRKKLSRIISLATVEHPLKPAVAVMAP